MVEKRPDDDKSGPMPKESKERRNSVSVGDLIEMRQSIEEVQLAQKETSQLVIGLLKGFNEKVIPVLDSHNSILNGLPGQLEASFTKQAEGMKNYIENRMKPAIETTSTTAPGSTPEKKGSGFDMKGVLDWADKQIQASGGIRNLLQGNQSGGLGGEIVNLEKEMMQRQRLVWRNSLRQALNLPLETESATASGPVVVKAP